MSVLLVSINSVARVLFIKLSDLLNFETSLKRKKPVKDRTDMSSFLISFKLDFNPLHFLYNLCKCSGVTGCQIMKEFYSVEGGVSNKEGFLKL